MLCWLFEVEGGNVKVSVADIQLSNVQRNLGGGVMIEDPRETALDDAEGQRRKSR